MTRGSITRERRRGRFAHEQNNQQIQYFILTGGWPRPGLGSHALFASAVGIALRTHNDKTLLKQAQAVEIRGSSD